MSVSPCRTAKQRPKNLNQRNCPTQYDCYWKGWWDSLSPTWSFRSLHMAEAEGRVPNPNFLRSSAAKGSRRWEPVPHAAEYRTSRKRTPWNPPLPSPNSISGRHVYLHWGDFRGQCRLVFIDIGDLQEINVPRNMKSQLSCELQPC